MTVYVALLRGINVGGNNLIKMPALKTCFDGCGFQSVATYIQSGNVLFASNLKASALTGQIEKTLSTTFNYKASVVMRSFEEMKAVVERAPSGFGKRPAEFRYDVIFLKHPLTGDEAVKNVPVKPGVDRVWTGDRVLYWSRLVSKAAESRLSRITGTPVYQNMTIRNWNTTTKLVELMARVGSSGVAL